MPDAQASSKSVLTTPLSPQPFACRMKAFDALSEPLREWRLTLDVGV